LADLITSIALMKCYGMSNWAIFFYFMMLICIMVGFMFLIAYAIPDSIVKGCTKCTEWSNTGTCLKEETGKHHCKNISKAVGYVIGAVLGLVVVLIMHLLWQTYLKSRIYDGHFFMGELFGRLLV